MSPALSSVLESWASIYSNSSSLRTLVGFAHVAGLVGGGGCAIVADRATLRTAKRPIAERLPQLAVIRDAHRVVLAGLALVAVSGVLLFAADADTFVHSRLFWIKMGLVALLVVNGAVLRQGERRAAAGDVRAWRPLTRAAALSLVLWFVITLAGAALPNIG